MAAIQHWFNASPVTLGVARLYIGCLLLFDLFRRWADLDVWYTNAGLMPNHTMLWKPQAILGYSLFYSVSELHEAQALCLVIGASYLLYLVGFKTKVMQVMALFFQVTLNCRVHYLTNGGDVAFSVLLLWSMFLPLGAWLSVDALLLKMKHSRVQLNADHTAELKIDSQKPELFGPLAPQFQWAFGAVLLQLAVIYFFNFVHKDTSGWSEGRVFHDVLHQDRIVTWLGHMVRPMVTPDLSKLFTQVALKTEMTLPIVLLLPLKSLWLRRVTVILGMSLHLGFAAFINVGIFSFAMIGFFMLLIPHEDMTRVIGWVSRKTTGATLYFDADCGVCTTSAKTLLCLQSTSTQPPAYIVKTNAAAPAEAGVTEEQVHDSVLWLTADKKQIWQAGVFAELAASMPLSRPFAWLLRLPIANTAYNAFAQRRHDFSAFCGLGTCGISRKPEPFALVSDVSLYAERQRKRAGLVLLAFVFVSFVIQTLAQNRAVPMSLKIQPVPKLVTWLVEYTHFYQGWGMFRDSPDSDQTVVVRARTVDGRLVDPLSERAARVSPMEQTFVPARLDHSEFFCDYISRITWDGAYHPPLRDWVLAYPQRTGNPKDQLVSFEVVSITDSTPKMGSQENTNIQQKVILTYP